MKKISFIFIVIFNLFMSQSLFAAPLTFVNGILIISDMHLNKFTSHEMEIAPSRYNSNNDLDLVTFTHLLDTLANNIQSGKTPKPSVILLLGDLVSHDASPDEAVENEKEVFTQVSRLSQHLGNVPVLYVFGNNDSLNWDYGPFYNSETKQSVYQTAQSTGWKDGFLSSGQPCGVNAYPCLLTEDKTNGYYSIYLQPGLRFIGLNSVIFSPRYSGETEDAKQELQWFESQLKEAESKKEFVLIGMHIPPGRNIYDHSVFWLEENTAAFLQLINKYHHIIIGSLASHTHCEEMKIIKNIEMQPIGTVLLTAGLSTSHGNAPSVKTLYYTSINNAWYLSNFDTWQFFEENNGISLNKLYDYNHHYCPDTSQSIMDCLDNINVEKMQKYYTTGNPNYFQKIKSFEDIYLTLSGH